MGSSIVQALMALVPILEPVAMQEFDDVVGPELQKLADGVGSPDLKILAQALAKAIQSVGDKEIPAAAAKL